MKTDNLDEPGENSHARTRGHKGAAAGSAGINWSDEQGNEVTSADAILIGLTVSEDDEGRAIISAEGGIEIGAVTPDGTIVTISSGADWRGFPGVCWLDDPYAATHFVGDRALLVYRHGTSHLAGGDIKGLILTVATADPWTFTAGSAFTIENVANDLRVDDGVSVIDIGGTDYPVVAAREYNGTNNLSPHILIADDDSATFASSSTWTRYSGPTWDGSTANQTSGRVHKLANGTYLCGVIKNSGGTWSAGVAITSDATLWTSPTFATIAAGYTEVNIEEMPDATLRAHLRNFASDAHYVSTSTDSGATWSAPTSLFTADGFPMFRSLSSGVLLTVYRSDAAAQDTAYRQSANEGVTWTDETILDATGNDNAYATLLQLDNTHVLVIYAIENSGSTSTDSDIYSQVFTDSSVFDVGGQVRVSDTDTTAAYLEDTLVAGTNVTLTKLAAGGNEQLEISVSGLTASDVRDAGRWETIVSGSAPPVAVTNEAADDWLVGWIPG